MSGEKKEGIMSMMKEGIAEVLIEDILPKVKPFFRPVAAKLTEYLGDDQKIIVIRATEQVPKLFVLDASDKAQDKFSLSPTTFEIYDESCILGVYTIEQGIDFLLNSMGDKKSSEDTQKLLQE